MAKRQSEHEVAVVITEADERFQIRSYPTETEVKKFVKEYNRRAAEQDEPKIKSAFWFFSQEEATFSPSLDSRPEIDLSSAPKQRSKKQDG